MAAPPAPWTDVIDGSEARSACVQSNQNRTVPNDEDCLHLNVYTPQRDDTGELLPVMVYIHGGAYQTGGGHFGPGYFLARRGVVFVSINYRLAALGFAYTGDGVVPGNMGLMDQVQALTFLQQTLLSFGGDPNQVTIIGESAGSSSVAQLIYIPQAAGLFQAAILESGTEFSPFATNEPELQPELLILDLAEAFQCPTNSSEDMVACLRQQDAQQLILTPVYNQPGFTFDESMFRPVIDGIVLPDRYELLREQGAFHMVPELIGLNENDGSMFLFLDPELSPGLALGLSREAYDELLWKWVNNRTESWPESTNPRDVYEALNYFYADWPYYSDPMRNRDMLSDMITDEWFGFGSDLHARYQSGAGNDVFFYVYDYVPEYFVLPDWLGAYHAIELAMVFGWPQILLDENAEALEHSRLDFGFQRELFTDEDLVYSEFIITLWTNFAKTGNPTPDGTISPNGTALNWSNFGEDGLNYMYLGCDPRLLQDYRQDAYAFWREYLPYLIYGDDFTVA